MAVTLTVNGVPYSFPETGELGWGEQVTDWAEAVTNQLSGLVTVGDIALTTVSIANNQSSSAVVSGLSFDIASTKGAFVEYNIERSVTGTKHSETGTLILTYNSLSTTWDIARYHAGTSGDTIDGVQFTAVNSGSLGQVYYTSDNLSGSSYDGKMRFRARVIR